MDRLYSNCAIFNSQMLPVSNGHKLYIEQSGNPSGIPILYIHGGPGAGLGKYYQWAFDPKKFHVIAFEQRGCGRSTPFGSLDHNTSSLLVEDMETIRQHFNVHAWHLFGGSWGSTLALLYSLTYPSRVISLVLRGIFLARQQDFEWFLLPSGCAAQLYPDAYERFTQCITPTPCVMHMCDQYFNLFNTDDDDVSFPALSAWYNWEGDISRLITMEHKASDVITNKQVKSLALLECFYLKNHCFIQENFILDNISKIQHIPCHIVHGRYDMVCKMEAAYQLYNNMENAQLHVIKDAGHSMSEKNTLLTLTRLLDAY